MEEIAEKYRLYRYIAKIEGLCKMEKGALVRETSENDYDFNERFLQAVWNEQRISGKTRSVGGRLVEVVSSGIWNNGPGPDFLKALLMIDGELCAGDIEIHIKRSDWYRHGHEGDDRYGNVILHAVWKDDMPEKAEKIPVVELSRCINDDWRRLLWEFEEANFAYGERVRKGECALRWAMTDDTGVGRLLEAAGMARFGAKAYRIAREMEERGEERAVLSAIFEALGYKRNRQQFRQIAEALDTGKIGSAKISEIEKEALLFGTGNMLPDLSSHDIDANLRKYVEKLWDAWWRLGQNARLEMKWDNSETRPYNRPWRRMAAGIELLRMTNWNPCKWLRKTASESETEKDLLKSFEELNNKQSRFREYADFNSKVHPAADLLGRERLGELACNALLTIIAAIGEKEGNKKYQALARRAYQSLPPMQGNRMTREASARFLTPPSRIKDLVKNTCQQQGIMDIYKNFCLALDNDCLRCPFSGTANPQEQHI